jgi:3-deoxy-D-manno-octulosonic-acid transferase
MAAGRQSDQRGFALTWPQRGLFVVYLLAWHLGLPVVLLYFLLRGRKEPLYRQFLAERFGYVASKLTKPIWLHSASLGELRGVMPLIDKLLAEGWPVLITTLTPAGRIAAQSRYAQAIEAGQVQVSYLPLELPWAVRRFAKKIQARCMVSSEIDTWPALLHTLKGLGIPLGFVNAQYPQKSFVKDQGWAGVRAAFFRAYDLVLCKSELHAQRFVETGCPSVKVVGELRFDLPVPSEHVQAALSLRQSAQKFFGLRGVICIASAVDGEDEMLLQAFQDFSKQALARGMPKPLLVYVPRSPQRFEAVAQMMTSSGITLIRRSKDLSVGFQFIGNEPEPCDALLGDSLGEMYFYLALADTVTVCGSFIMQGSHNVIEPLAINKPVIVGPSIWGIEYPGQEALAAGVLTQVQHAKDLPETWLTWFTQPKLQERSQEKAQAFMREHSGSVAKHWQHLRVWLNRP